MKPEADKFSDFIWEEIPLKRKDIYLGICTIQRKGMDFLCDEEWEEIGNGKNEKRISEMITSRILLKHMANRLGFDPSKFYISKKENGKPFGFEDSHQFFVSISHTGEIVAAVLSESKDVGLDIELMERKVSNRLKDRILHDKEKESLQTVPLIQTWTIKESVLKLTGTGLRKSMSAIKLQEAGANVFITNFEGREAYIQSFPIWDLWVSLSYWNT